MVNQARSLEHGAARAEDRSAVHQRNGDQPRSTREFEVTVLTTRSGSTCVVIQAPDREEALSIIRDELSSGEFTAPPEHCTDDVQIEIWSVRELAS